MQCEEVREQFADYVRDASHGPVRPELAHHLAVCESCRTEAGELKELWETLGYIPAAEPSPQMRARFETMLEAYSHGLDHAGAKRWWQSMYSSLTAWWPRQPLVQFGLALGLLILGFAVGHQTRSPASAAPNGEITQLRSELAETRQMVALSLMQQQSASDRLKGVNWSYQLQQPGREVLTALLDTLMHDPNVNVRLATIDALRQFGDQPVVRHGVVEAMARQESPMIQVALIELAVDLRDKESVGELRRLSRDEKVNETVRERAQKGLAELE